MVSKLADCYHDYILEMHHHKCVICERHTDIVHEIVPRSRLPKKWILPENRVPLCDECHFKVHREGASTHAENLKELREKRLLAYASSNLRTG